MDPMELLKLLGIVIVVVGFACKLDSILVIMVAGRGHRPGGWHGPGLVP